MGSLRNTLNSLTEQVIQGKVLIKPADKGSIIVVMSPQDYWQMCLRHLDNDESYKCKGHYDPSELLDKRVEEYAIRYKSILTEKEFICLKNNHYKVSKFYMLPKLHKSKRLNEIIKERNSEYISITEKIEIEGRPIVAGPLYHTSKISEMLHIILEPTLSMIPHILRDSFDFKDRVEQSCNENTLLSSCDIKSLYTNIRHDVFIKAIEYWIEKLGNNIPLLSRITHSFILILKSFILEVLSIILKYNYFYINDLYYNQIKGTAMGAIFAVVGSNLTVAYFEVKMFAILPQIYPNDFVDFFIRNYFRFLDDVFMKWLSEFDIQPFYELINGLDPDIKFIFEEPSTSLIFLDINIEVINGNLQFDIYHKPTNSFSYLNYKSCHPPHTKNNISLSLAKRIVRIVSQTRNNRLEELKCHLKQRKHPEAVINYSFTKLFEPQKHTVASENLITFKRTYNPNHHFSHSKFLNCVNSFSNRELKNSFKDKKVILTTRQSSNLKKLLVRAKFQMNVIPRTPQLIGLYPCSNCIYHKNGYINPCTSFKFKLTNGKIITWNYTKYFTCDSKNVLYLLKCRTCNEFYIGETRF